MSDSPVDVPTLEAIERLVLGQDMSARDAIAGRLRKPLYEAIREAHSLFADFQRMHATWPKSDRRIMSVALMLHAAANNLITSLHLLAIGLPVPAGNLMRQYFECTAMALLFSDSSLPDFAKYDANKTTFDAQAAVSRLGQKKVAGSLEKLLGFDNGAWRAAVSQRDFYHKHSHSTVVSIGFILDFRKSKGAILVHSYDPKKHNMYKKELTARTMAIRQLHHLVRALHRLHNSSGKP